MMGHRHRARRARYRPRHVHHGQRKRPRILIPRRRRATPGDQPDRRLPRQDNVPRTRAPGARALHKRRRNPLRRRGIEAEATAYLVAKELELIDWDAAESRAYIQRWLGGPETTEGNISRVFAGVTRILGDETAVGPANDETAVIAVSDAVTQLRESQDRWRGLQKNRKRSGCAHPASRIH
jgi:hypothetical protein